MAIKLQGRYNKSKVSISDEMRREDLITILEYCRVRIMGFLLLRYKYNVFRTTIIDFIYFCHVQHTCVSVFNSRLIKTCYRLRDLKRAILEKKNKINFSINAQLFHLRRKRLYLLEYSTFRTRTTSLPFCFLWNFFDAHVCF